MEKRLISTLSLLLALCLCLAMTSCNEDGCPHTFDHACDGTCGLCDYVRTTTHVWEEADCFNAMTCRNCTISEGEPHGHSVDFGVSRTADPQVCTYCHLWVYPDNHTETINE